MTIELWYPGATKYIAPNWKIRGYTNSAEGVIWHSAEGTWEGLKHEINRTDRGALWHLSCLKNGMMFQHAPLNAVLWHAGDWGGDQDGADGNGECIAIEFEGEAGEQLTPAQIEAGVNFVQWLSKQTGWKPTRTAMGRNQWEHRELSDLGTACPSSRIPWPVVMAEFDKLNVGALSKPLDPSKSLFWSSVFDAVGNTGTLGSHERMPEEKVGFGTYKFHLKYQ